MHELDNLDREEARERMAEDLSPANIEEETLEEENRELRQKLEYAITELDSFWQRIQDLEQEKAQLEAKEETLQETVSQQSEVSQEKLLSTLYVGASAGISIIGVAKASIPIMLIGVFGLIGTLGHAYDVKNR